MVTDKTYCCHACATPRCSVCNSTDVVFEALTKVKFRNTMVVINVCVVGCQFFVVLGKENKDHHCVIKSPKMLILEWKESCEDQEMSQ